ESKPHAVARRVAIPHRKLDIRNPGATVFERQPDPGSGSVLDEFDLRRPAPAVIERVAGEFAGGRDELGLVRQSESERDGFLAYRLADDHDVFWRLNFERLGANRSHRPPLLSEVRPTDYSVPVAAATSWL